MKRGLMVVLLTLLLAPTVLDLLNIKQPPEMTGASLIRAARSS